MAKPTEEKGHGDVVGKVGDYAPRRPRKLGDVECERVRLDDDQPLRKSEREVLEGGDAAAATTT